MPADDSDDGEEETLAWAGISKFLGRLESNLSDWHKEEKASEKKRLKGAQDAQKELARVKARVLSAPGVTAALGDLADGSLREQMTALHEKAVEQRSELRKLLALLSEHATEHKLEDEDREPLAEQLAPALEGEHLELEAKQVLQHFRGVMDAAERQAKRAETRARKRDKSAAAPAESAEDPAPPAEKAGTDDKGDAGGKDDSGDADDKGDADKGDADDKGTGERRARKGAGRAARANRRRPDDDSRDDYSYYSGDDSRDDSRSPSRRRGGKGKGRDRRPRPRYSRSPRRGPGRGGKGGRRGRDDDRRSDRDYDRRRSPRGPRGKGNRRGGRDRRDDRDDSRSRGRGSRSRGRGSRSRGRGSRTPRRNGVDMRKLDSDLERFVKVNRIDHRCETELRGLSPDSCMRVMHKPTFELSGDVRNPMAVVNARIRTVRSLKEDRGRR